MDGYDQWSNIGWWRGLEKHMKQYLLLLKSLILTHIYLSASAKEFSILVSDVETIWSYIKWTHDIQLLYLKRQQFSSTHVMAARLQNECIKWGLSLVQHLSNLSYKQATQTRMIMVVYLSVYIMEPIMTPSVHYYIICSPSQEYLTLFAYSSVITMFIFSSHIL